MAAQNSTRIWETPTNPASSPTNHNNAARSAQLPSITTLTSDLPPPNAPSSPSYPSTNRTSDPWGSQTQSTRSSAYSSGFGYASSVNSPHRASNTSQLGATSYPAEYNSPNSAGVQASPGFAPSQHAVGLPHLNQHHHDPSQYRGSQHSEVFPSQESRRSSLGSQVNTGFGNLQINGVGSPYANSGNPSHSSIAASLQRERGIPHHNGIRNSGTSSTHQQPLSHLGPIPGESRQAYQSRTAPIISSNPMKEVYNAEKPTAGQPYAFPDPDLSNRSSGSQEANGSTMLSRKNSDHTSITSSIVTNDSKMPHGQHRLDDDPMPGTHHHSLQHKRVSEMSGDPDSPDNATPYSRTPALRASHKLAERKRRTEMKHLFDALRAQIPASHGSKASKWEILSKASDHIKNLESSLHANQDIQIQVQQASHEVEAVRRENEALRNEIYHLSQEMQHARDRPGTATAMHPHSQAPGHLYAPQPQGSMSMQMDPSRSLPPLTNGMQAGSCMQGVQYTDEQRR
ncbi:MAG: hypothetical protein Q9164_004435 [Protoblastenia rupestris]